MNPYPERIEQLHHCLASRYGQRDREATEIILAALLEPNVTGYRRPWLVIETDYPKRDTADAWFSFGSHAAVHSLSVARLDRQRDREWRINTWLEGDASGATGLFTDSEWRRLSHMNAGRAHSSLLISSYNALLSRCLRLRVAYPKGDWATRPDRDPEHTELARLTRRVLDDAHRQEMRHARDAAPPGMFYWCELLQKASTLQTDWDVLTGTLAATCRNICTLYNDPEREPDWRIAERLIRDSVNYATADIMRQALHPERELQLSDPVMMQGALRWHWQAEVRRLKQEGILVQVRKRNKPVARRYSLGNDDWRRLVVYGEPMFALSMTLNA